MMTPPPASSDKFAQALEEHTQLRHILSSIRATLAARQSSPAVIGGMFAELATRLQEHFAHEETGGYFNGALELAPRLSDRADELLAQHPDITARLRVLQLFVTDQDTSDAWWQQLQEMFERFLELFMTHEAGENALLQQSYTEDIGTED